MEKSGFSACRRAPAVFLIHYQLAQGNAKAHLKHASVFYMTAYGYQFGAAAFSRAVRKELLAALIKDDGHAAQRLHIVDQGGFAVQTYFGQMRRFDSGTPCFPFNGVEHGGILAAYIGSSSGNHGDAVIKARNSQDIFSQVSRILCILQGCLKNFLYPAVLSAYVDITLFRAEYISRNEHAFYDAQGRFFQQHPVLKGAGLSFVRIAYNILCIPFDPV